jgi:hypothetical protein
MQNHLYTKKGILYIFSHLLCIYIINHYVNMSSIKKVRDNAFVSSSLS